MPLPFAILLDTPKLLHFYWWSRFKYDLPAVSLVAIAAKGVLSALSVVCVHFPVLQLALEGIKRIRMEPQRSIRRYASIVAHLDRTYEQASLIVSRKMPK